jgi:hypothetical protein
MYDVDPVTLKRTLDGGSRRAPTADPHKVLTD